MLASHNRGNLFIYILGVARYTDVKVRYVTSVPFPYTHTKHISASIAKIGRLLYQHQIQTLVHLPLCHRWNVTELT